MLKIYVYLILLSLLIAISPVKGYGINHSFTNMDNQRESYEIFEDEPVLIEAFATWCKYCKEEHKELVKVYDNYNDSIQLMSLSIDGDKDDLKTINDYLNDYPSPWTIGWDENEEFKKEYNIQATPSNILFDSQGNFVNCWVGLHKFDFFSSELDTYLLNPTEYKENHENNGLCKDLNNAFPSILLIGISLTVIIAIFFIISSRRKSKVK